MRKWKEDNPERVREWARENYRRRSLGRNAEAIEYAQILRGDLCCYCGAPMEQIDHIVAVGPDANRRDPLVHEWDNLTAACRSCNMSKRDHSLLFFLLRRLTPSGGTGLTAA